MAISTTKACTLNPVYVERFVLDGAIGENDNILPMFVKVLNKNPIKDQPIGVCYIDLEKGLKNKTISKNVNTNKDPQWY